MLVDVSMRNVSGPFIYSFPVDNASRMSKLTEPAG
ncbi:hypothetical protein LCGC14_0737400 [marine sediment metagenome]|uniref:Uncharacterized protein n=1 Tax=marine sediment metagenome TaxID=412755 RepID=A0A0F9SSN1_9ZZZZ